MAPPANTVGPRLLTTTIVLPMVPAAAAAEPAAAVQGGKPSLHNQPAPEVYAIVEVAGKQMFVEPGKWYVCNRLQVDVGDTIRLGRVLALKRGDEFNVGRPYLEDVNIEAEVVEELRGPKVRLQQEQQEQEQQQQQDGLQHAFGARVVVLQWELTQC
eukprot:gene9764-9921_t